MGDRILITGASGALGGVVVEAMFAAGYHVRGQYARTPGPNPRVEWRQADLVQSLDVDNLVQGCVAVVNLVGEVSAAPRMYRLNVEAPRALLDAAARAGVSYFAHASSISVHGSPIEKVIDEDSRTIDLDADLARQVFESPAGIEYARTKLLGELALRRAPSVPRIDLLRISKSAGFDRLLEATRWSFARRLLSLHGNSLSIFERDCADAIVFLTERGLKGEGDGVETINVADSTSWTHAAVIDYVRRRMGGVSAVGSLSAPPLFERLKNAVKYRTLSPRLPIGMARIKTDKLLAMGFSPAVGYARALEMAVDARLADLRADAA